VLLLATGLCGASYAARARKHRRQPGIRDVQSIARTDPITSDIKVYLDGMELSTMSVFDDKSISPIMVDGQLMIPVRFVEERLDKDLFLDRGWGIIQPRAGLLLKIGSREWHTTTDYSPDGLNMTIEQLATAPREIRGRLYMPMDHLLFNYMQLPFEWNPGDHTLRFSHRR
jgi:hypothetical protein